MPAAKEKRIELIRQLFATFKSQEREVAESLLTEDFSFTSPYDNAIDKEAYFERCWPNAALLKEQTIERILVEEDSAYVSYLGLTHEGTSFRNTEFFSFKAGQIHSIEVYFGAIYHQGIFTRMT